MGPYCFTANDARREYGAELERMLGATVLGVYIAYDPSSNEWVYDHFAVISTDRGQISVSSLSGFKISIGFDDMKLDQDFELFEGDWEYGIGRLVWKPHETSSEVSGRRIAAFDWHCDDLGHLFALDVTISDGRVLRVGTDYDETVPEIIPG